MAAAGGIEVGLDYENKESEHIDQASEALERATKVLSSVAVDDSVGLASAIQMTASLAQRAVDYAVEVLMNDIDVLEVLLPKVMGLTLDLRTFGPLSDGFHKALSLAQEVDEALRYILMAFRELDINLRDSEVSSLVRSASGMSLKASIHVTRAQQNLTGFQGEVRLESLRIPLRALMYLSSARQAISMLVASEVGDHVREWESRR